MVCIVSCCAPTPQALVPGLSLLAAGCSLPLIQPANWELSGFCQHRDPRGQLLGKLEEFLVSFIDVLSCGWDPLASPVVSGAALWSLPLQEGFGTNKKGRTGPLWRHCCLEILHLTLEQLSFVCKKVPAWHCQLQAELNPSSENELCHSWSRKTELDFSTSLICSFWKRWRQSQTPKLGKTDLGMTEQLNSTKALDAGLDFDPSQGVSMSRLFRPTCPSAYVEICGKDLRISPQKCEFRAGACVQF